jgi:hypothetical protein
MGLRPDESRGGGVEGGGDEGEEEVSSRLGVGESKLSRWIDIVYAR